ncbi:MAG: C39 family peptidase [Chloroflexi bacterium]|uniref:C39 family peptidase n=1 Tax=Candidatus Chlorohelix allophototropha TaxID=3003348 RepID=A0A8T7M205_9CHLR|nr:C39 family peptidase [Chloroflexota bacterium]WJW65700.1 C39 family peptidase [Chloroflexota bacterium L227-S17]
MVHKNYRSLLFFGLLALLAGLFAACGDESPVATLTVAASPTSAPTITLAPSMATATAIVLPTITPSPLPTATQVPPTATPTIAPSPTPAVPVKPIAQKALLEPMSWESQKWNNCGPVSAMMVLSYYGIKKTQDECATALKPAEADKKVRPAELVDFLTTNGVKTLIVENGNLDTLRKLLSNGIPVITQSWLKPDDDIAHYRVIRGFDTTKGTFIVNDSMFDKASVSVENALEDTLWKAFDHRFLPVYTAKSEPLVKAILGVDFDSKTNLTRALAAAESFLDKNPRDLDGLRNAGYLRATSGNYEGALQIWDRIVALGPYGRFLWYQMWPLESLNKLGKYQQALKMTDEILQQAPVYSEAHYERAVALVALNRKDEAKKELKLSLLDGYYQPSRDLLDKLGG